MREELVQDADQMENICILLGDRQDIWQDRIIYWIAVAVLHLLREAIRGKDHDKPRET